MHGEEIAGRGANPSPAGEDADDYSGNHVGAKRALNGSSRPRPAFSFRRDLEFVRPSELAKRLGCAPHLWARAITKELVDNALDAVEEAGEVLPEIQICIDSGWIEVADNGPGMAAELVAKLCDRNLRTSAREAYPTPDRGRQGNALQVLMCLALGLGWSRVEHTITSKGIQHTITLTVDRLAQEISLDRQETPVKYRTGTTVRIGFPFDSVQLGQLYQLQNLILDFAALNPHAAFTFRGAEEFCDDDGDPIIDDLELESWADGVEKWSAAAPVPPHWYGLEKFGHRVLLELNRDHELTVAQFLGTFKGLSSTQRRATVATAAGLPGAKLSALLDGRSIDAVRAGRLLAEMQGASKPPKPSVLGGVGRICVEALAISNGVGSCPADFTYLVVEGGEQVPWRWEVGFAELPEGGALYLGHNFSPLVAEDIFLRSLSLPHGIGSNAPVFLFLHRIAADPASLDYGKSSVVIRPEEHTALRKAIDKVAKRYVDRCNRELADEIRELDRAERREADAERNERHAEKSASILPWRPPGRQTPETQARYEAALQAFCDLILDIKGKSEIEVSSRGWAYLLEEHGLRKGDFDTAQALINDCRKSGLLPLEICVEDGKRLAENLEEVDPEWSAEEKAESIVNSLAAEHYYWTPISFWEDQPVYVECLVEKIDLKSLFGPLCASFHIPITNAGGWTDLNSRAAMMRRFKDWEAKGRQCVLLYCGDHDPGGLQISGQLRSNLAELSGAVGWSPDRLTIDRFGLNHDFIEEQGLTWIDNLRTAKKKPPNDLADPKHPDHRKDYVQDYLRQFGARKCEANALVTRQAAARQLCLDAITRYLPEDAPEVYLAMLAPLREELRIAIANRMPGSGERGR